MAGALGLRGLEGKGPRELGESRSGDPAGQQAPLPPGSTRGCPDTVQRLRQQRAEVIQSSLDARERGGQPSHVPGEQRPASGGVVKQGARTGWSTRGDRGVGHSLFFHIEGVG